MTVDDKAVDEQRRRADWLEILARTDQRATEYVRQIDMPGQIDMPDGGADFPFSNPEQINPTMEYGASGLCGWNPSNAPWNSRVSTSTASARC
jgi:hypothetical protein